MRGLYEEMCVGELTYTTSEVYKMLEDETSTIIEADNIEHECCYWKDNRCILNKNHCPDSYDCDDFD